MPHTPSKQIVEALHQLRKLDMCLTDYATQGFREQLQGAREAIGTLLPLIVLEEIERSGAEQVKIGKFTVMVASDEGVEKKSLKTSANASKRHSSK